MSSTVRGFAVRDVANEQVHGQISTIVVSFGKALPQTATGNLFTVTGTVQITGLVGVVSTVFGAVANSISLGITGNNTLIAAAATFNATAAGSVLTLPGTLGGALPAAITGNKAATVCVQNLAVTNTIITMTTSASTTGNVTWFLAYIPLFPKLGGSVVVD